MTVMDTAQIATNGQGKTPPAIANKIANTLSRKMRASRVGLLRYFKTRFLSHQAKQRRIAFLRETSMQFGLYVCILTGAVGITYVGSGILLDMVSQKMTKLGGDIVRQNAPVTVTTAQLRRTID